MGSSIINVSGVVGVVTAGLPQIAYTASKAGLLGSPGYLDRSVDLIPARRSGEAAEIVAVIVFLASDGSSLVMLCGSRRAIAMVRPPSMGTVTPVTYPAAPAPSAGRNFSIPRANRPVWPTRRTASFNHGSFLRVDEVVPPRPSATVVEPSHRSRCGTAASLMFR